MRRARVILPQMSSGIHQKLKRDGLSPYGDVRNIPPSTSGIGPSVWTGRALQAESE